MRLAIIAGARNRVEATATFSLNFRIYKFINYNYRRTKVAHAPAEKMPGKSEEDAPEKMEHPYQRESYTDTFSRAFTEMDFVGQEQVK